MEKVLQDIRELSSGTISTISGYRSYKNIDCARYRFYSFTKKCIKAGEAFETWHEAWSSFVKESVGSGKYQMAEIIPNAKDLSYQSEDQREHLGLLLDKTITEHINTLSETEIETQLSELREELKRSQAVIDSSELFEDKNALERRHAFLELEKKYLLSSYLLVPDEDC